MRNRVVKCMKIVVKLIRKLRGKSVGFIRFNKLIKGSSKMMLAKKPLIFICYTLWQEGGRFKKPELWTASYFYKTLINNNNHVELKLYLVTSNNCFNTAHLIYKVKGINAFWCIKRRLYRIIRINIKSVTFLTQLFVQYNH